MTPSCLLNPAIFKVQKRKSYLFICLFIFGCVGSLLLCTGFLQLWRAGATLLHCTGFSLRWLLLLRSTDSRRVGFSSCGTWVLQLWRTGLVAPWHVGSSRTRDQTRVPCIGRWILNHCATRESLRRKSLVYRRIYRKCKTQFLLSRKLMFYLERDLKNSRHVGLHGKNLRAGTDDKC